MPVFNRTRIQTREIRGVPYYTNILGFQPIYNIVSFVDWSISMLEKEALNTTSQHLINNAKTIQFSTFVISAGGFLF